MKRRLEQIEAWIDALPPTIRPAAYGAFLVLTIVLMRGAFILVPILIVYDVVTSRTPMVDIGRGAAISMLAMVGGAASGLAYGLVGRHVQHAFPGGRYLTGIVTILPYVCFAIFVIRLVDHKALWTPFTRFDLAIVTAMTLFFGSFIGYAWFGPDEPSKIKSSKRQHKER